MISLGRLTWIVGRDVNRTFGGGLASMELLRRTFIAHGALDETGNAGLVAISRLTPGTNVLAYCVGLGWSLHRWAGAVAALAAASLPASAIIVALTVLLIGVNQYPVVRMLLALGMVVATALVFSSAWFLLRPYLHKAMFVRAAIVIALSAALLLLGLTPVRILLIAAAAGAILGAPSYRRPAR